MNWAFNRVLFVWYLSHEISIYGMKCHKNMAPKSYLIGNPWRSRIPKSFSGENRLENTKYERFHIDVRSFLETLYKAKLT